MTLTLSGQKPADLDPVHTIPIRGTYDPMTAVKQAMITPLFEPLGQGLVHVTDGNGNVYTETDILDLYMQTHEENVNGPAEAAMKGLYRQALIHYDPKSPRLADEIFANQAAATAKLPTPGPKVIYGAASDVIPAAKKLISGAASDHGEFFASLAYTYSPNTLAFSFQTATAFKEFTTWLSQQMQQLASVIPAQTSNLIAQFQGLTLDGLTEALVIRADDRSENGEYSFARTIVHMLMAYHRQKVAGGDTLSTGVMAFTASELFLPRTIVMVNAEAHARATSARRVDNEWRLINISLASPIKVVSNRALSKLTALPRAAAQAAARAATARSNKNGPSGRSARVTFRKQPPNEVQIYQGIMRALMRMKKVNHSQNIFRTSKTTYQKANRRDPDDPNRPGRITSVKYLPDIHIYLDCSGSISEDNYQQAIKMLITLAQDLKVNLFFNSFSDMLSEEVMLKTANRSIGAIWNEFARVPKVQGGTEFSQIWRYINMSKKRKQRFSLVITDFGWAPPRQWEAHPQNLYYAPVSNFNWDTILRYLDQFQKGMGHIDPAIAAKLIGIVA